MPKQIESERKYLVKFPKSWSELSDIFNNLIDIKRISQTYLKPEKDGEQSPRVRETKEGLTGDISTIYHYNKKKTIEAGVNEEEEREISKSEYEKYLKSSLPDKMEVQKTRFVFKYKNQIFELDVFKGPLKGLAIMEIELKDINDKVNLPPFLDVIKEVTKNKDYTNYALADQKYES